MDIHQLQTLTELPTADDKTFCNLQAQMALQGIELHRITGALGREAFSVNVRGQLRTLDHLPQVAAYARCLGVPVLCS